MSKNETSKVITQKARALAFELVQKGELSYTKMLQELEKTFPQRSKRSHKNYVAEARKQLLEKSTGIDPGELESSRWARLTIWADRSQRFQTQATLLLGQKNQTKAAALERVVLKYEELIAKACFWFDSPPERDLSEAEIRRTVLAALGRQLHHFEFEELELLRQIRDQLEVRVAELEGVPSGTEESKESENEGPSVF